MPKPQEEDPVYILAIHARSNGQQLWRVEKTIVALPNLDQQLRALCDFHGKLPDRGLFSGHAPAKIDARRTALNSYFEVMLDTPMNERAALLVCGFFSSDVIGAETDDPRTSPDSATAPSISSVSKGKARKEGYLTKRGKNFGGWKARYFILEGPEFRYYEAAGGAHLGTIKLQNAQIGKQSQQQSNQSPSRRDDDADNQYRHAFLILEPKRKDSSSLVRHVLCAESDEERDMWVEALLQHVDPQDLNQTTSPTEKDSGSARGLGFPKGIQELGRSKAKESPDGGSQDTLQGMKYDDTVAGEAPVPRGPNQRDGTMDSPQHTAFSGDMHNHPSISAPTNGVVIQNAEFWGNKTLAPANVKDKKRSIFGFRGRSSSDLAPGQLAIGQPIQQPELHHPARNVFGIPLAEAVEFSQPVGVDLFLPAVVYRCLEYLKAKNAYKEEGIFRLSGSNIVIKALRERFNTEGDIRLLDGQYYDVHAVASLLKLYLRELPASVLTRELHLDFLKVLDLDEREKKIAAFNVLVHKLPRANCELIQALSSFLIDIVNNADLNKMTVRNVGIVFAPTLNIPAPLISMFLTDYVDIFGTPVEEANSPIHEITINAPVPSSDAIRSPRRQMFQDLPTPAYNQTSFQQPSAFPHPGQHQQHAGYDTGFIPLQPSYDAPHYSQPQYNPPQPHGDGFGSLNGALQADNSRDVKQRRRESGMLLVNMGLNNQRKSSMQKLREDSSMVQEESAFD
ncbi:RhoGAP-domain-containing protein [Mytilinidion resinicola]|uniref:RhoGAP-domain-containing protein n=1 Tax=Mytilinidion resinicola TaxID=574789 RepID=A0A6A6YPN8_9PEZI|nr:RhoGAP-domain-containing protein [Mytilinidion resinicola]KAF2809945.1 RhoGAP-domain-containing protein [Mytilinidion resinicola]